jgi:O-antigen/teichoic acid export membrane protein
MSLPPVTEEKPRRTITENILWNFLGQGWLFVLAFLATPYIIHALGVDLYGIYVLIAIVIDYFAFLQFGMGTAAVKYVAEYLARGDEEGILKTFWTGMITHLFMGILGMLLIFAASEVLVDRLFNIPPNARDTAIAVLRIGSIGFLISMIIGVAAGAIRAAGRFDLLNGLSILLGTLQIAAAVILLQQGFQLVEVVLSNVVIQFVGLVLYGYHVARLFPFLGSPRWDGKAFRELLRFGSFVTVSGIVGPILTNIEKLFITSLCSVSALTYYAVPFSLMNRLSVLPSSFSAVLFPAFSALQGSNNVAAIRDLYLRSTLYLLLLYWAPLMFFLYFGGPFLSLWIGVDFAEKSTVVLVILGIAGLVNAVAYPAATVLQGLDKPQWPAFFHLAEMVVYLPAGYLLIREYGIIGAAAAWLLRVFIDTVLLHGAALHLLGESPWKWCADLASRGLPPLVIYALLFFTLKSFGWNLLHPLNVTGILTATAIYALILWRWVLDQGMRGQFVAILHRS